MKLPSFVFKETDRISKLELFIVTGLTLVAGLIGFYNLGSSVFPQTMWQPLGRTSEIKTYKFDRPVQSGAIFALMGLGRGHYQFLGSVDGSSWEAIGQIGHESVYDAISWQQIALTNVPGGISYLKVLAPSLGNENLSFYELGVLDKASDSFVNLKVHSESIKTNGTDALIDEPATLVQKPDFRNGMIFDEVYHVRSAYEEILGKRITETSHPSFGKTLISMGISYFGFNPFGWRFVGTALGVLMIPLLYGFCRVVIGSAFGAVFASFIFCFEHLRYTQARLATLDSIACFFILCTLFFLVLFGKEINKARDFRKWPYIWMLLSGICFGLGLSTKWSVCYLAPALPVILGLMVWLRHRKFGLRMGDSAPVLVVSFLAFVVVPFCLYFQAFWMTAMRTNDLTTWTAFIKHQRDMYNYHSNLVATHPFSSRWWEWPIMARPLWIYSAGTLATISEQIWTKSIVLIGSPLVFWGSLVAIPTAIQRLKKQCDIAYVVPLIVVFALYLPWAIAPRSLTFIYHFFPVTPFVISIIAAIFDRNGWGHKHVYTWVFATVTFALFCLFFPVLGGLMIPKWYIDSALRWFEVWIF